MANKASILITFDYVVCTGTWARSGTTLTVTFYNHELTTGQIINVTSIDGSQTTGIKTITVTGTHTFTYTVTDAGGTSGDITYRRGTGDPITLSYISIRPLRNRTSETYITVDSITGDQTEGVKTITSIDEQNFTFTGIDSGDTSGVLSFDWGTTGNEVDWEWSRTGTTITVTRGNVNLELISNTVGGRGYFNIGTSNESCASNYAAALNRDYGISGLIFSNGILATATNNTVTVEALYYSDEEGYIDAFIEEDLNWYNMVATDEVLATSVLSITGVTYSGSTPTPCTYIRRTIAVEDAVYPVTILSPTTKVCANSGELWFDYARNWNGTITLEDDDSNIDSIYVPIVETLYSVTENIIYGNGYVNVILNTSLITNSEAIPLILEYSLDDVTYQYGNTFYGLFSGDYTGYVKDQYGCKKTVEFTVLAIPDAEKPSPFFEISLNQSFQIREVQTRDFDTSFPNMFEDLYSDNEFVNRTYKWYSQKFKLTDTRKIQIRSTYDTVSLDVYSVNDLDTIIDTLEFDKTIENIGLTDARDCFIKSGGDNTTYVYFTSGNTYDYGTLDPIGQYNLGGSLEYWMTKETIQNIQLSGSTEMDGEYEVIGYAYDTTISASVLIIGSTYNGGPSESCIAKFVYNSEDFDVYETTLICNDYGEGCYLFTISATDTDTRYEDKNYISEPFEIIETIATEDGSGKVIDNLVLIKWASDSVVNDIDFRTGIENGIRIEGTFYDFSIDGEKEVFDDDDGDIFPIKATKKRYLTLKTHDLPPYLIDLIATAITEHKYVLINGIQVQTKEYPSIESIDQGSTQTLSVACQVMNTTTYISNDITGENINYNVLGTVYSTTKKVLGV